MRAVQFSAFILFAASAAFASDAVRPVTQTPLPVATPGITITSSGKPTNAGDALHILIPTLDIDNASFGRVIDELRERTNANIVVHWKVLEAVGITRETPVTLHLSNVRVHKIFDLLFDQVSPGVALTYTADENVIEVTTQDDADRVMVTRVYAIDDLVMSDNRALQPPTMNLQTLTQSSSGGNTSSGSLFTDNNANNNKQDAENAQQKGEAIAGMVRDVVRPSIWKENGGTASVRYFSGKLIVTAPISVQEALAGPALPEGGRRFGF